jgi:hypothetical protein
MRPPHVLITRERLGNSTNERRYVTSALLRHQQSKGPLSVAIRKTLVMSISARDPKTKFPVVIN